MTDSRWLTGRGFGVHSPWAYQLIETVINEKRPYYAYEDLFSFWEAAPQYMPQYTENRDKLLFRLKSHSLVLFWNWNGAESVPVICPLCTQTPS